MNTPGRLRRIEKNLNNKFGKKLPIFPIMGGLSSDPNQSSRNVTPQEAQILQSKRVPVPIRIALSREQEFLEYLESE